MFPRSKICSAKVRNWNQLGRGSPEIISENGDLFICSGGYVNEGGGGPSVRNGSISIGNPAVVLCGFRAVALMTNFRK